jgi:ABC-2 type transport system ATP-binding protein
MSSLTSAPLMAGIGAAPATAARREPVVRVDTLTKSFPARRGWRDGLLHPFRTERVAAVQGVTFEVRAREFFGLLGPNGAGKTTLFKMLATSMLPDGGMATVAGFDVARQPADVRRVLTPVVGDERSLNWRLSARENLRLFAVLHDVPRGSVRARVDAVLQTVGLSEPAEEMVRTFSSGMRQRLLIARALLSRPQVLLLDEPTRSLDPVSARDFRRFLREEIVGRQGCTVLLATHSAEEAFDLCDRVGVLDRGRLLAVGPTAELSQAVRADHYRVWTTAPEHPYWSELAVLGQIQYCGVQGTDADDWTCVDIQVPGGLRSAADVVEALTLAGIPVARFERVSLSLADLIEQIVAQHTQGGVHA